MKEYELTLENGERITVLAWSYADALLAKDRMDDGERIAPMLPSPVFWGGYAEKGELCQSKH